MDRCMASNSCNKRRQLTLRMITQSKYIQTEAEAKAISSNWVFLCMDDQSSSHKMTTSVLQTAINRSKVSWGTASMNTASPFGASRATLDLLPLLLIVTYQRLLRDSRSGLMRNMLKDDIKRKHCYLAETTLLRSFKFALTESVSTYSGETKGSLLPLAIQNPSKLQNSPPPRGISRGWFKMLEGFTCPSKNRWIRDWTVGWDDRSNCVRKLKQNPWQKMQTMQVRLRFFLGKTTFTSLVK